MMSQENAETLIRTTGGNGRNEQNLLMSERSM